MSSSIERASKAAAALLLRDIDAGLARAVRIGASSPQECFVCYEALCIKLTVYANDSGKLSMITFDFFHASLFLLDSHGEIFERMLLAISNSTRDPAEVMRAESAMIDRIPELFPRLLRVE